MKSGLFSVVLVMTALAPAQTSGRFEEAKRLGVSYLESGQFDKAAGKFEEIWEENQSDAMVAENLALAYLNGEGRRRDSGIAKKALELMKKAVDLGGRAPMLVLHSQERMSALQGREFTNYCSGTLGFRPGKVQFVVTKCHSTAKAQPFDLSPNDIQEIDYDNGGKRGGFRIKTKDRTFHMAPRTFLREDADLIMDLARQYLAGGK